MTAEEMSHKMKDEITSATSEFITRLNKQEYDTVEGAYVYVNLWVPKQAALHLAEVAIAHHSLLSLEELTDFICLTCFTKGVHAFQKELQKSGFEDKH